MFQKIMFHLILLVKPYFQKSRIICLCMSENIILYAFCVGDEIREREYNFSHLKKIPSFAFDINAQHLTWPSTV